MRAGRRRGGNAILEFALVSAVLMMVLFGVMDYGRVFGAAEQSTNAANAGAAFAAFSVANSADLTAITNAAKADAPDATAMTVSATSFCTCTFGGPAIDCSTVCVSGSKRTYVRVDTALPFHTLVEYPLLPGSTTLRSSATVRIQ
jgi:Flp pilus assembly protein TadG